MNRYINNDKIRQVTFIAALVLLGYVLFNQLQVFLPAFLGALTLYVIMRKAMFRLHYQRKWKAPWAAALLMTASFLVILVPIGLMINLFSSKVNFAVEHAGEIIAALRSTIRSLEAKTGFNFTSGDSIDSLGVFVAGKLPFLLGATFNTITTVIFMYLILYFMLVQGSDMERTLSGLIPMSDTNLRLVAREVKNMVLSNAIGIPLIAIFQGVIGLAGYLVIGVPQPLFWFAATCISSMLPVVGATVAYASIGIILFAQHENVKAIIVLAYGFGIISTVDGLFRVSIQKKIGDTHPLVTAFGVIIGINLFGFIGLIFGPLLISLFLLLVKIYRLEFSGEPV